MSYASAVTAVKAMWTAHWPSSPTYTVIWRDNATTQTPDITEGNWLHLSVDFLGERNVAFGSGRLSNEKAIMGTVIITVFTALGSGESTTLSLLDTALGVFRSRRDGALSFLGEGSAPWEAAIDDGNWFGRSAALSFVYRFQG